MRLILLVFNSKLFLQLPKTLLKQCCQSMMQRYTSFPYMNVSGFCSRSSAWHVHIWYILHIWHILHVWHIFLSHGWWSTCGFLLDRPHAECFLCCSVFSMLINLIIKECLTNMYIVSVYFAYIAFFVFILHILHDLCPPTRSGAPVRYMYHMQNMYNMQKYVISCIFCIFCIWVYIVHWLCIFYIIIQNMLNRIGPC